MRGDDHARISAIAVPEALVSENGYDQSELPSGQTLREILNRLVQTSRYS
ncbi:hypothetical protein [Nostoc sp.]